MPLRSVFSWLLVCSLPTAAANAEPRDQSRSVVRTASRQSATPPPRPEAIGAPQAAQRSQRRLGLDDLEAMALANQPALAQAAAELRAARGAWIQAGKYPNPETGYVANEMGDEGTSGMQGAMLRQELVTFGKRRLQQNAASQEVRARQQQYEAMRLRVLSDVRGGFYEVLAAQQALDVSRQLRDLTRSQLKLAEDIFKAKEVAQTDVLQARVEVEMARIALVRAEQRNAAAWRKLAAVVGLPDMQPEPLAGKLEDGLPKLAWDDALGRVLAQSPELGAAAARIAKARWELRRAEVEPKPNVTVGLELVHNNATTDDLTGVEVSVPLPLWNRNQGNILKARAEVTAAQAAAAKLGLGLQHRLAGLFQRYASASEEAERYASDILPAAKQVLDLTTTAYRQGESNFFHVLIAQRAFFQARLAYIEALRDARDAAATIDNLLLSDSLR